MKDTYTVAAVGSTHKWKWTLVPCFPRPKGYKPKESGYDFVSSAEAVEKGRLAAEVAGLKLFSGEPNAVESAVEAAIQTEGEYLWSTCEPHANNSVTMGDFLINHLPDSYDLTLRDESYAEIFRDGLTYEVHAGGNGDAYSHCVRFELS